MEKIIIILLFISINSAVISQNIKKWKAGVYYSNDYTYTHININNLSEDQKLTLENPSLTPEKGIYGFVVGGRICYLIKKFEFSLGINISNRGYQNGVFTDFIPADPNDPVLNNVSGISYRNKYRFIEFPIKFGYRLIKKDKFIITCFPGFSINSILRRQNISYTYHKNDQPTEIDKYNYYANLFEITTISGSLGFNFEYVINEKINIFCGPEIIYYSKSITDVNIFLGNLYAVGIKTGINYKF